MINGYIFRSMATYSEHDESFLLHEFFEKSVRRYPKTCAIEWYEEGLTLKSRLTYEQLHQNAMHVTAAIGPFLGVESVGAIFMKRSSEKVYVAQLAVLMAGGAYTCIDTSFPNDRVRFILDDVQPGVIITDKYCKERVESCTKDLDIPIVEYETIKGKTANKTVLNELPPRIKENNIAYVIYTSGTTGQPKGVLIEHRNICNLIRMHRSFFPEICNGWRVAQISSVAYDSSIEEIYLAFAKGGTLVVVDDETIRLGPDLSHWLRREQINVLTPPPTLLRSMGREAAISLPYLRIVYVGGEDISADLVNLWSRGRRLVNGYGPTECSVVVTVADLRENEPVTIGKVVPNNTVHVLNENLDPVERGQKGELCISGASVARGYLNRPELTSAKFFEHPTCGRIYRTGDLVQENESRNLFYYGRIDSQIKIRGYRVELASIEAYFRGFVPEIGAAVCTVVKHEHVQKIVAFVILHSSEYKMDISTIKSNMSTKLPSYMIPSDIMSLRKFPTTTSGKLDKNALCDIYANQVKIEEDTFDVGVTEVEKIILQVFKSNLNLSKYPSKSQDFFELGGDSLISAMVISDLRKHASTAKLAVRDIYDQRTIGNLANICSKRIKKNATHLAELPLQKCPLKTTLVQLLWILILSVSSSIISGIAAFSQNPNVGYILGLLLIFWLPLSVILAVCAKWLLIGKYTVGTHPVWGWFYLRHWVLQTVVSIIPWSLISGTYFQNAVLRALGADIGENVYIHGPLGLVVEYGGWDLLRIADNVVVGRDARVSTIKFERHHMHLGRISIEENVLLQTKSYICCNTQIGQNSVVKFSSLVSSGTAVPAFTQTSGVPGVSTPLLAAQGKRNVTPSLVMSPARYTIQFISMKCIEQVLTNPLLIAYQTDLYMSSLGFYDVDISLQSLALIKCMILVGGVVGSLAAKIALLIVLGKVREGTYNRRTFDFMRICIKDSIVTSAGNFLSGTIFWPVWLRWAGMRVGRKCEISTIMEVIPELICIDKETFFADKIYLGGPRFDGDCVIIEKTHIGAGTFLGNHVVIPPGSHLPQDILIGVCSVADQENIYAGSSWFGNPLFELPRREVVSAERSVTHDPSTIRFLSRLFWELLRFTITIPPAAVVLVWYKYLYTARAVEDDATFYFKTVPLFSIASLFILPAVVVVLKWCLVGKMRAGVHPLWSCWCSRWDYLYIAWFSWAKPILSVFYGTQVLNGILRLFGVSIGKNVFLSNKNFSQVFDPDLLHFEDDTTIGCDFQAHTFEDRVLKKAPLFVRRQATVSPNSILMYGSDVGKGTVVKEQSVVMKNEVLPESCCFIGCPTRED